MFHTSGLRKPAGAISRKSNVEPPKLSTTSTTVLAEPGTENSILYELIEMRSLTDEHCVLDSTEIQAEPGMAAMPLDIVLRDTLAVRQDRLKNRCVKPGNLYNPQSFDALVAQLDRVPGYEPGGRGFESCRARQILEGLQRCRPFSFSSLFDVAAAFIPIKQNGRCRNPVPPVFACN
jgi:hypothetical protein